MKNQTNYGFPLSYIFFRALFLLLITIILFGLIIIGISIYFVIFISIFVFLIYIYFIVIQFKIQFLKKRKILLNKFIELADIKGDENILDIGTGSGFLAIGLTKYLKDGFIVGLDKYSIKSDNIRTQLATTIKTNFIGNTLKNAEINARIENVEKKCKFI